MTRTLSITLAAALLLTALCGCQQTALPLDVTAATQMAVQQKGNPAVSVVDADVILTVSEAVAKAAAKSSNTDPDTLPEEQYRITFYDEAAAPLVTLSVFSETAVQAGTVLYEGDFTLLLDILDSYFQVTALEELSPVFSLTPADIAEIAFHHVSDGTYKIMTDPDSCQSVFGALLTLTVTQTGAGEGGDTYLLYVRSAKEEAYFPPITLTVSADGATASCQGRSLAVSAYDWNGLYQTLPYNTMPIPGQ